MMSGLYRNVIPATDADPWAVEEIRNAKTSESLIRELGPVVWLNQHKCFFVGQHAPAQSVLTRWREFSSTGRPFQDEQSIVPQILVTEDPPAHTRSRDALMQLLSPPAIKSMREEFTRQAEVVVDRFLQQGTIDGVQDLASSYILKIFPDAIGLPEENRERVLKFGEAAFNGAGPRNKILADSLVQAVPAFEWIERNCNREVVTPNGLAGRIYGFADEGILTESEADLLVMTLLGAGFDTTMVTIGNTLHAFSQHPEEWSKLHANPLLAKNALEETLRYDPPARMMGRLVTQDLELEGAPLQKGDVLGVFLGAAGRDPRRWENADQYDLTRKGPHLGFGVGVHSCAGQALARLEFECLFSVLAQRVKKVELIDTPERLINNNILGWIRVPLKLHAA